jgi:hypothetical protein
MSRPYETLDKVLDLPLAAPELPLSVVVPVSERAADLLAMWTEVAGPLHAAGLDFEVIFVLDPKFRDLADQLAASVGREQRVRVLVAGQSLGEPALVKVGLERCTGRNVLLLPAYSRVEAEGIPLLIQAVEAGADMAVARRWPRRDSWINRVQHRLLHTLVTPLAGGRIHDTACGVQVVRREVLEEVPLYGDLYRFLPLIVHREGFRVAELDIAQHPADVQTRVYAPGVYLRRVIDLLGLFFLLRFTEKPLRFFGLGGSLVMLGGMGVLAVLFWQRIGGQGIADRPLLVLGVMLVVLGVQAIALGLIGEIIVHLGATGRRPYRLAPTGSASPSEPLVPAGGYLVPDELRGPGEFPETGRAGAEPVKARAHAGQGG